jgi:hypothetical protein
MKARFTVHRQVLSGLKYVQVVSRGPLRNRMQEMIVSRVSLFVLMLVSCSDSLPSSSRAHILLIRPISPNTRRNSSPIMLPPV